LAQACDQSAVIARSAPSPAMDAYDACPFSEEVLPGGGHLGSVTSSVRPRRLLLRRLAWVPAGALAVALPGAGYHLCASANFRGDGGHMHNPSQALQEQPQAPRALPETRPLQAAFLSHGRTLKIANESPDAKGGATIYDKVGGHSINVFGTGGAFCDTARGGCVVPRGQTGSWELPAAEVLVFGIQWNLARLAPDGRTCDNLCRQVRFWPSSCEVKLVPPTEGYCGTVPTPAWTPGLHTQFHGDTCVAQVTKASSVDHGAALCSCSWGAYPCTCPGPSCTLGTD